MFFLAMILKLRMQQVVRNGISSPHLLEPTCWQTLFTGQDELSIEPPLMMTLLPSPPYRISLRLVWRCDAVALADLTSWWTTLEEEMPLQVGSYQGSLESVHLDDTPWAAVSTWADITAHCPCRHLRLTFITPMIPTPSEDTFFAFPEPIPVFSRLYERWNTLGGPQLSMTVEKLVSTTRCVVSDYRLTTVASCSTSLVFRGCDGWVAFEYRTRHSEAISILNMLARLAFYTGLGYYTERGMGATSVVQEG